MADNVTITLAHPLTAERAGRLRVKEVRDYQAGEQVSLPPGEAHALIGAGYASGVDPSDADAVRKALTGDTSGDKAKSTKKQQ